MNFFTLSGFAWRNVWRNRRRTFITLSGIAFGMFLSIMFTGLGDSMYGGMIDQAAQMGAGHVTIQHPEQLLAPSAKRFVTDVKARISAAKADPMVRGTAPRITGQLMLAAGGESRGTGFIALDPTLESADTFSVLGAISAGELFKADDPRGVVLGAELASNLGVKVGRKVIYTTTDRTGEIINGLLRVRGIITTGADSLDSSLCLLPLEVARKALGYGPDEATQITVLIRDQRKAADVAARLGVGLGQGAVAVTWKDTMADLSGMIDSKVKSTLFLEALVLLLIGAGIFNTLFVSVMERAREFGVLMAIGWQSRQLFTLVMLESLWLALVGVTVGALVTAWPYWFMTTTGIDVSAQMGGAAVAGVVIDPVLRVAIYPENAVFVVAVVCLSTLASGLLPAWRAGQVRPVDAIKLV